MNRLIYVYEPETQQSNQSCASGRIFRVVFGLKVDKISGLIGAWCLLVFLGATKNIIKIALGHRMKIITFKHQDDYLYTIIIKALQFVNIIDK